MIASERPLRAGLCGGDTLDAPEELLLLRVLNACRPRVFCIVAGGGGGARSVGRSSSSSG